MARIQGGKVGSRYNSTDAAIEATFIHGKRDDGGELSDEDNNRIDAMQKSKGAKAPKMYKRTKRGTEFDGIRRIGNN